MIARLVFFFYLLHICNAQTVQITFPSPDATYQDPDDLAHHWGHKLMVSVSPPPSIGENIIVSFMMPNVRFFFPSVELTDVTTTATNFIYRDEGVLPYSGTITFALGGSVGASYSVNPPSIDITFTKHTVYLRDDYPPSGIGYPIEANPTIDRIPIGRLGVQKTVVLTACPSTYSTFYLTVTLVSVPVGLVFTNSPHTFSYTDDEVCSFSFRVDARTLVETDIGTYDVNMELSNTAANYYQSSPTTVDIVNMIELATDAPENVVCTNVTASSVQLEWDSPVNNVCWNYATNSTCIPAIISYSILSKSSTETVFSVTTPNTGSDLTKFMVTSLQPGETYQFQVVALNSVGPSPASLPTAAVKTEHTTITVGDTFVSRDFPSNNYGSLLTFSVSPKDIGLLRFVLDPDRYSAQVHDSNTLLNALLYLSPASSVVEKAVHYALGVSDNGWDENTISYSNSANSLNPMSSSSMSKKWSVSATDMDTPIVVDVSSLVLPLLQVNASSVSIAVVSALTSAPVISYHSKEAVSFHPSLVLSFVEGKIDDELIPYPTSCQFSDSGLSIQVGFNMSIYSAAPDPHSCVQLLTAATMAILGVSSPSCNWEGDRTLVITLGNSATINVGGSIEFLPDVLFHKTGIYYGGGTIAVQAPVNPVTPTVVLLGPSEVGSCSLLLLDGSSSYGFTDRAVFEWSLVSMDANSSILTSTELATHRAAVENKLSSFLQDTTVFFSALELHHNVIYTFSLTIHTYLVGHSSNSESIVVRKGSLPSPDILLQFPSLWRLSHAAIVRSLISLPTCAFYSAYSFVFRWSIVSGTPFALDASSYMQPHLYIPPGTLQANSKYTLRLTTIYESGSVESFVSFTAIPSAVVAKIVGGSSILASVTEDIAIDGSTSYDPDDKDSTSHLRYGWSCVHTLSSHPGGVTEDCDALLALHSPSTNEAHLFIPAGTLSPLSVYRFVLRVWRFDEQMSDYEGKTQITLVTVDIPAPIVQIHATETLVNHGDILRLAGLATSYSDQAQLSFRWEEIGTHDITLNLDSSAVVASSRNSPNLVIKANILAPGDVYTFRLTVFDHSQYGSAEIEISVNAPPLSGTCLVSPATGGKAMSTQFKIEMPGWQDLENNLPLMYYVELESCMDSTLPSSSCVFTSSSLSDAQLVPSVITMLPAGQHTILAYISDALGATSYVRIPISVDPKTTQPSEDDDEDTVIDFVKNVTNSDIAEATGLQDLLRTVQLVEYLASILNNQTHQTEAIDQARSSLLHMLSNFSSEARISSHTCPAVTRALVALSRIPPRRSSDYLMVDLSLQIIFDVLLGAQATFLVSAKQNAVCLDNAATVLSNMLGTADCTILERVILLLERLFRVQLDNVLAGEEPSSLLNDNLNLLSQKVLTGNHTTLELMGIQLRLPEEVLASSVSNSTSTVYSQFTSTNIRLVKYGHTARSCMNDTTNIGNNTKPISDVIAVVVNNGTSVLDSKPDKDFPTPVTFTIPLDKDAETESVTDPCTRGQNQTTTTHRAVACEYWDKQGSKWSSKGCNTLGVVKLSDGTPAVMCECYHLTEFAIILREELRQSDCLGLVSMSEKIAYSVFSAIYLVISSLALYQVLRILCARWRGGKFANSLMLVEHVLVMITALLRTSVQLLRSLSLTYEMHDALYGFLAAMPYCCEYIMLIVLVFSWANTFHYSMSNSGKADALRKPLIASCISTSTVIVTLFIFMCGYTNTNALYLLSLVSAIIMAVLSVIVAVAFILYGSLLIKALSVTGRKEDMFIRKLFFITAAISLIMAIEGAIWIWSVIEADNPITLVNIPISFLLFYALDIACLLAILRIYVEAISQQVEAGRERLYSHYVGSGSTSGNARRNSVEVYPGKTRRSSAPHIAGGSPERPQKYCRRSSAESGAESLTLSPSLRTSPNKMSDHTRRISKHLMAASLPFIDLPSLENDNDLTTDYDQYDQKYGSDRL